MEPQSTPRTTADSSSEQRLKTDVVGMKRKFLKKKLTPIEPTKFKKYKKLQDTLKPIKPREFEGAPFRTKDGRPTYRGYGINV